MLSLGLIEKAAAKRSESAAQSAKAGSGAYTISGEGDPAVDALVLARYEAKKAKDFAEADRIREELKAQGIEITDTKENAADEWVQDEQQVQRRMPSRHPSFSCSGPEGGGNLPPRRRPVPRPLDRSWRIG